jgi:DNA (cytosine-5)-methyltransferase 1
MESINNDILLVVIDSFCGAGGVTEGFHRAEIDGKKIAKVVIGINHDAVAIESHKANHPDTHHFVEDFTELDPHRLVSIIEEAKRLYPNAKVLFWASAECTHHSKAKGGLPRDADSRSLPEHIARYVRVLQPDFIGVENVREFLDWGPLDENNKPVKEQKGTYYRDWRDHLIGMGYDYDYRLLNAADFGAFTSRSRYFGLFSQDSSLINFPVATHSKSGKSGLEKWKAVRDVLNLDIEGESIFTRKKPLVDATLHRIYEGVYEFAIKGNEDFLLKYNSMNQSKKYKCPDIDAPSPVVSCQDRIGLGKIKFASLAYSGRPADKNFDLDRPASTVTTVDHHQMITAYYGNGFNTSIESPCNTLTTNDRFALITSKFIQSYYSGGGQTASIEEPSQTIMTVPKQNVVSCKWLMDTQFKNMGSDLDHPCRTITANRKHFYLMNPQFACKGASIEKPCFTLIARMDKLPPYLMQTVVGGVEIIINESDSEMMKKLKQLCNKYGIIDILMRMLLIEELKRIMGFGDGYILKGTKAEMKKFIGNAVECTQAKVFAEAIGIGIRMSGNKRKVS